MAYKMSNGPLQAKLKMVKGPKGEMVPEYAVDGKGANDAAPTKMMKNPVTKMAKSMAYASYKAVGKQVTDPPKKGEGKWDYIDDMGPQVDNTPEGRGQATRTVDKIKSAVQAPFSDKTYADFKKEYRDVQKSKHREQKQKREDWFYYHLNRSF